MVETFDSIYGLGRDEFLSLLEFVFIFVYWINE